MMYRCLKEDLIYFENCVDFTFLFPNGQIATQVGVKRGERYTGTVGLGLSIKTFFNIQVKKVVNFTTRFDLLQVH